MTWLLQGLSKLSRAELKNLIPQVTETLGPIPGLEKITKTQRMGMLTHGAGGRNLREKILGEGFKEGTSAELMLPGTSASFDPLVAKEFARKGGLGSDDILRVFPTLKAAPVQNLSPAEYLAGEGAVARGYVKKPNFFFSEDELFTRRGKFPPASLAEKLLSTSASTPLTARPLLEKEAGWIDQMHQSVKGGKDKLQSLSTTFSPRTGNSFVSLSPSVVNKGAMAQVPNDVASRFHSKRFAAQPNQAVASLLQAIQGLRGNPGALQSTTPEIYRAASRTFAAVEKSAMQQRVSPVIAWNARKLNDASNLLRESHDQFFRAQYLPKALAPDLLKTNLDAGIRAYFSAREQFFKAIEKFSRIPTTSTKKIDLGKELEKYLGRVETETAKFMKMSAKLHRRTSLPEPEPELLDFL